MICLSQFSLWNVMQPHLYRQTHKKKIEHGMQQRMHRTGSILWHRMVSLPPIYLIATAWSPLLLKTKKGSQIIQYSKVSIIIHIRSYIWFTWFYIKQLFHWNVGTSGPQSKNNVVDAQEPFAVIPNTPFLYMTM